MAPVALWGHVSRKDRTTGMVTYPSRHSESRGQSAAPSTHGLVQPDLHQQRWACRKPWFQPGQISGPRLTTGRILVQDSIGMRPLLPKG